MMKYYKTRDGKTIEKKDGLNNILKFLYDNKLGRILLKPLVSEPVSKLAGKFCDSRASEFMITPFIKNAGIDLREYEPSSYYSYNDFFTRKIKKEKRPVDMNQNHLISPCDSKLFIIPIGKNSVYSVKNSHYSIKSLLRSQKLSKKFEGGICMIFRLEVDDYHRYIYIDSGEKSKTISVKGFYHTVNPKALETFDVYNENTREITLLKTDNFSEVAQIEVGAMMVGRISNYNLQKGKIKRGQEKGRFEYGGSTIILLFKKDCVIPDGDILKNSKDGFETIVKMGEKIGIKA